MRTLGIENWLQKLKDSKLMKVTPSAEVDHPLQKERNGRSHKGLKAQPN